MRAALAAQRGLESSLPLRHWLSLKTHPLGRLVATCRDWDIGVEVVSEFELAAMLSSDVPGTDILVNGVGKHHWLPRSPVAGLTVHFDSLAEVRALAGMATALAWRVGLRCAVPQPAGGFAPVWDQFGLLAEEVPLAAAMLHEAGARVRGLHVHLQTNVARASGYRRALDHLQQICACADLEPEYLDVGGGLPVAGERPREGPCAASTFDMGEFREVLRSIPEIFPSVREVWLENGRFLTGAAGALVVTVLDKKERGGRTYLICDGGRVNHARVAATEVHDILLEPNRGGPETETIVCGPTCGAVDRLGCWSLPASVVPGDLIIWLNAGAYHIPLETRFSFGVAPVVWFNQDDEPEVVRERETPAEWWRQWGPPEGPGIPSLVDRVNLTNREPLVPAFDASPPDRQTWAGIAAAYATYTSPLRPCREDVEFVERRVCDWRRAHPDRAMRAVLLGVTPDLATLDWPSGSTLVALDRSPAVIEAIWPGDVRTHRWAVCGTWLTLPLRPRSCDIVVGDGSLNALCYPEGFRAAAAAIRDVLADEGMLAVRCYVRPDDPEDPEDVIRDLLGPGIADINHFKFRLFVAMQASTEAGSPVRDIYRFLRSRVSDETLRSMPGWSEAAVSGFELWRNADTVYTFPTLQELRDVLGPLFCERAVRFPSYALGNCCPTLLLAPR